MIIAIIENKNTLAPRQGPATTMSDSRILEKTDSGRAALATGHASLDFVSRTALILVDGKLSVDAITELLQKSRIGNDPATAIQKLIDLELVKITKV